MRIPDLEQIKANLQTLKPHIVKTPVLEWQSLWKERNVGVDTRVFFKAELFQKTGTFKIRGALTRIRALSAEEKKQGVVAGTGGNHGIAVAYAAKLSNVHAKIIVPKTMNQLRLERIKSLDAEVLAVDDIKEILDKMNEIANQEDRAVIHPFEHELITLGTATLGYEFLNQVDKLDNLIIPIGGGGLASGVACAAKQMNPAIKVYGVEPEGANSMFMSFKNNKPYTLPNGPKSIADSLSAPCALPYSFAVCQKFIDEVVLVSDDEIRSAMKILFEDMKLACEPACAASTAALLGPLKDRCSNSFTGAVLCGSNIDTDKFHQLVSG